MTVPTAPSYRPFGMLRFLLALSVVFSHTWELSIAGDQFLPRLGIGNVAVMGFFVLSGFIITEALTTFYAGRPAAFLGNRLLRIVPPYWAALLVSVAIHAALASQGRVETSATETMPAGALGLASIAENALAIFPRPSELTFDLTHPFYGFVRFYWAVYIELVFYVVAFLVAAVTACGLVRRIGLDRFTVIAAGVVAIWLHLAEEYGFPLPPGVIFPGAWGFAFSPYFLIGVCLYFWIAKRERIALAGLLVSYGLLFFHFTRYVQGKIPVSADWAASLVTPHHALPTLLILAVPATIWRLARLQVGPSTLSRDRKLGDLSYPIYLNHWAVIVAAHTLTDGRGFAVQSAAIMASVALSWLLMRAIETPIGPLRDRLRGRALGTMDVI